MTPQTEDQIKKLIAEVRDADPSTLADVLARVSPQLSDLPSVLQRAVFDLASARQDMSKAVKPPRMVDTTLTAAEVAALRSGAADAFQYSMRQDHTTYAAERVVQNQTISVSHSFSRRDLQDPMVRERSYRKNYLFRLAEDCLRSWIEKAEYCETVSVEHGETVGTLTIPVPIDAPAPKPETPKDFVSAKALLTERIDFLEERGNYGDDKLAGELRLIRSELKAKS